MAGKKISRRFTALFMACFMALSCVGCGGGKSGGNDDPGDTTRGQIELTSADFSAIEQYNLALVLDTSGSVNDADPEHKAMDAACMFLDSLFMAGTEGKNRQGVPKTTVGVVAYNNKAETIQVISEVPSESSIVTLKKKIYSLDCPNGSGDAGLGDAVYKAVSMLKEANPSSASPMSPMPSAEPIQKNMIVLFTDGYTGTLPFGNASASMSAPEQPFQPNPNLLPNFGAPVQERLAEGLNLAFTSQTEIFVVGLDVGGIGSQWKQFRNIANYTQRTMTPPPGPGPMGDMNGMSPMPGPVSDTGGAPPMPGSGMPPGSPPGMPEIMAGNSGIFTRDADDTQDANWMNGMNSAAGVNYYRATSIVQVQYFYVQLLASLMQGSGAKSKMPDQPNEWSNYYVDVDAAGNSALLFFLLSENVIAGMRLFNPDGKEIDLNRPDKNGWNADRTVRLQWWKGYTTLSVMDPEQGTWVIMAKDERGINDFQAQYILVGGLVLELTVSRPENQNSLSSARVLLQAAYRGEPVEEDFYRNAECTCEVFQMPPPPPQFDAAGQGALSPMRNNGAQGMASQEMPDQGGMGGPPPMMEPLSVPLTYNASTQAMEGEFSVETPGDYQVRANMDSSEVSYNVEKSVSLMPGTPQTISFSGQGDKKNLKPSLIGWDNLSITVSSWTVEPEGLISVNLNNNGALELQAQRTGTGSLSVIVYSSAGTDSNQQLQPWKLSYPIQVG